MNRLLLFLFVVFTAVAARSCIIQEKKDEPEIHVIHLGNRRKGSGGPEILALHIPDDRRKREVEEYAAKDPCKNDNDCEAEEICLTSLGCVKISWETMEPQTSEIVTNS